MSFPKKHRLNASEKYATHLRKMGITASTSLLRARYLLKKEGESKFAVTIGKKISKRATVRNRLRRRIHEGVLGALSNTLHVDMIIYPTKESAEESIKKIKEEISSLFNKIQ